MKNTPEQDDHARENPSGALADMVAVPSVPALEPGTVRAAIVKIAILGGLFSLLNFWQFQILVQAWRTDQNWSHGFIIPLFSLFLLYNRRGDLFRARVRPCVWALPLMILALIGQVLIFRLIGTYWLCQLAMLAVLFFLVLYQAGTQVIRITWLPILYLALAMPIPDNLYARLAVPLQEFAAQGATVILQIFGVQIKSYASHLDVMSRSGVWHGLTVEEACSGVRSLMAYVALGVAWAYLEDRPIWQRVVLVLSIVPVAIICNVARVTITCSAYVLDHPELGQKIMHEFTGMLMLIPALVLFLLLSWLLKKVFVEDDDEDESDDSSKQTQAAPKEAGA